MLPNPMDSKTNRFAISMTQKLNFFFVDVPVLTFSYKASMVSKSTTELSTVRTAETVNTVLMLNNESNK